MQTYICVISGLTPLLMHRFSETADLGSTTRKIHITAEDPREVAERVAYRNADGALYVPGAAIAAMLREAGAAHKQRGSRKSLKYIIPAATLVVEDQIVLRDVQGEPLMQFEVDSRPVVIPSTKGRIMRHRPRVNQWSAEFTIEIDETMIEATTVHQLISEGGMKHGVLDNRVGTGGSFGRFHIVSWGVLAQRTLLAAE